MAHCVKLNVARICYHPRPEEMTFTLCGQQSKNIEIHAHSGTSHGNVWVFKSTHV